MDILVFLSIALSGDFCPDFTHLCNYGPLFAIYSFASLRSFHPLKLHFLFNLSGTPCFNWG